MRKPGNQETLKLFSWFPGFLIDLLVSTRALILLGRFILTWIVDFDLRST
jgi:hypothetical protein